ncbi:homoserine O-acetyltransferase/O-succinyltransferase family protein [Liquorilactobacillus nagelii]|uniref:homoserine O-acetyltransferase/O-succinyltransferase family protein n=1 Tax=Liquorilactobacillus nagelii TaxID=82688 RepID=UPI001CCB1E54|nr:homoserine O-succinyltransferase [Liquorilactobacillus nagelii]ULQ48682.1 homoserine O-succinyltransferase [Liquorilactobacillus nagelii]
MSEISPLSVLVVNLMPDKAKTQQQLTAFFKQSKLTIKPTFCYPATHRFRTSKSLIDIKNYVSFSEIQQAKFDGLIITGAAIEQLPFTEIDYWPELCRIFEWSQTHCRKVLTICWAAQAGMYYFSGVSKHLLNKKIFGIYPTIIQKQHPLLNGFKREITLPFSRYTTNLNSEIPESSLQILASSAATGPAICATRDDHNFFVTGHPEYQSTTLLDEYLRDQHRGRVVEQPANYFISNSVEKINESWLPQSQRLFNNWFNLLQ